MLSIEKHFGFVLPMFFGTLSMPLGGYNFKVGVYVAFTKTYF
jgi:hypothetical protein